MKEFEFVTKRLECVTKHEKFTSLTIHFSSQSDKYSTIYSPLKIKFFWRKFQNFQEFLEIKQISKTLKMSWNSWNLKFRWNSKNSLSHYVLFSWIRQIFAHIIEIQKQVHKTRNKCKKQETSAKNKKQVQKQEIFETPSTSVGYMCWSTRQWTSDCQYLPRKSHKSL